LRISNCSLLLIYIPQKDERLSRPGWLTYSGRFTHISGESGHHQLQVERRTGKVRRSKTNVLPTVPRNQLRTPIPSHSHQKIPIAILFSIHFEFCSQSHSRPNTCSYSMPFHSRKRYKYNVKSLVNCETPNCKLKN